MKPDPSAAAYPIDPESHWQVSALTYEDEPMIVLRVSSGGQEVGICLLPEDVDAVIGALQRARAKADPRRPYEAPACTPEGTRE